MRILIFCFLVFLSANSLADLKPLKSHENQSGYYHAIRCSSIFAAQAKWAGSEKLGKEVFDGYFDIAEGLFTLGIVMATQQEKMGTVEQASKAANADLTAISQMYLDRFRDNYARDGFAWQKDDTVNLDHTYCLGLARYAKEKGFISSKGR